ncbi:DUF6261 family protein [Capnocytophaga felis]|uniref:Uncharacterized protein n=1 Tax=Capnocytophaga felis TaxID=2267611 RepID=A0A5M4B6P1_9FLAO|nr:DUF6261 family protein [Capnocytophaga felis]GET44846.1 hypothetical protein RCZ01_01480 [Capnocytophaga felis]GET48627.1 hypothetical protein RCZ02_14580 [Capnocytophaga felis]
MSVLMDISLPNLVKLNNDEYAQFIKGAMGLIDENDLDKLAVRKELFTSIQKNLDLLTEASRQTRSSKESENINRLEKQRSELLSYVISSFRLAKKSSMESHKESAQVLVKEFKNYSRVASLPTRQKSQAIDALIKDLEKPEISKHLNALSVSHAVASLKQANTRYQELVGVRAETQATTPLINVKKVRKEAHVLYKELVRFAFSNNVIHPSEESKNFITLLSKLMEDTMNAYKQRLGQLKANKNISTKEENVPSVS